MNDLPSRYSPQKVEDKIYNFWQEKNLFKASANSKKRPYCIIIPPPNITGILHMGHALNNTIQDILIRYKRMCGFESLWMPGTDHAGIATQNVIERELANQGLKRDDIGREEFIRRLWEWKKEYGDTIIHQLKKLGCSCDWSRTRFTLDEQYSEAVKEVFVHLYEKGLIYRGNYIINWCPRCQTALSDEEAQHKELKGILYYIKYPFKDNPNKYLTVATTRPETMLGDTAVAVNPKDSRYKNLIGKTLILPLINRQLKIISDESVDPKFGTGVVKVTPAHDPNDFQIGLQHSLEFINIFHPNGILNKNAGEFAGLDRFEARESILEILQEKKLLEKSKEHIHSVGHCYRCHTIVEPYLSKQWFVRMKPLAKPAIEVVKKGQIRFTPARWSKVYLNWMENIRDWCISRQIWWGHRIPVWYCQECPEDKNIVVSRQRPDRCYRCGSLDLIQDPDVLDTWFSSWLWPFATFYWPKESKDLRYFYPTDVLVTAPEIIFFWVARMIMAGIEFMKDIPFRDVYIHGTVRDDKGVKMSKSLGNAIDPLEIIDEFGADALRFSLIINSGQDLFLSKEKFEVGRNFANKVWNASRLVLMHLKTDVSKFDLCQIFLLENLALPERWILSRLYTTIDRVNKAIDKYRFNEAENLLYEFFWHQFCDWYLEIAKPFDSRTSQIISYKVLEKVLRILHPFMPFITEEIWQKLNPSAGPIMVQSLPHIQKQMVNKHAEAQMQVLIDIIVALRSIRNSCHITPQQKINAILKSRDSEILRLLQDYRNIIEKLSNTENISIFRVVRRPSKSATMVVDKVNIYVPLEDVIDIAKEKMRMEQQILFISKTLKKINTYLKNKQFLDKAPNSVIESQKIKQIQLKDELTQLKKIYKELN
jgi:valyl-tRNA synthetase